MIPHHPTLSTQHTWNRIYELKWLMDIQLYSERFENSRISDIKAEIGIEGYDLDPFLGTDLKFSRIRDVPLALKRSMNQPGEKRTASGRFSPFSQMHLPRTFVR